MDQDNKKAASDPFGDMRENITKLESRIDMHDQLNKINIDNLRKDVDEIEDRFDLYVTLTRYSPVEKLVYGMVGLILTLALVALMSTVLVNGPA